MCTLNELKDKDQSVIARNENGSERQQMLADQHIQLAACIRAFFDKSGAFGPVCFLNDAMINCAKPAEGLRISSLLMRLERFDKCIRVLQE